jgi:hypothetical protein
MSGANARRPCSDRRFRPRQDCHADQVGFHIDCSLKNAVHDRSTVTKPIFSRYFSALVNRGERFSKSLATWAKLRSIRCPDNQNR